MKTIEITDKNGKVYSFESDVDNPTDADIQSLVEQVDKMAGSTATTSAQPTPSPTPQATAQPQAKPLFQQFQELPFIKNIARPLAEKMNPNLISETKKTLQDIGAGTYKPPAPYTLGEIFTKSLEPVTAGYSTDLMGSERLKKEKAIKSELIGDVNLGLGAAGLVKQVPKLAEGAVNLGKRLVTSPQQIISKAGEISRATLDATERIDAQPLIKKATELAVKDPEGMGKVWKIYRKTMPQIMTGKDLRLFRQVWDGFQKLSEAAQESGKAQLFKTLYDESTQLIKNQIPKAYEGIVEMAKAYPKSGKELEMVQSPLRRFAGKAFPFLAGGASIGAGGSLLLKLLGVGGGGGGNTYNNFQQQ